MPAIRLADGSVRQYDQPITVKTVAADISSSLLKVAVAAEVDNQAVDLSYELHKDVDLRIITTREPAGLEILRHSCAHLLAHAVLELFPGVEVTIGPVIEDGFYYDFDYQRPFTLDDLPIIEKKMQEIAKRRLTVQRQELTRPEAIALFRKLGQEYKVQIIEAIPGDEVLTAYAQGDFIDLCRGPHIADTRMLKAFKLLKVAGAYWRGDSNNRMLSRIYGTAWASSTELNDYLQRLQEAEKRDHRLLAKKMQLFHMQDIAPGAIFWHPHGWTLYRTVRDHVRSQAQLSGYQEINTPLLVNKKLWVESGHAAKFIDDMFVLPTEQEDFVLKPMNCPCHVQVFNQGMKSYRDLPLRLFEFGCCHRNEPSGTLHGLMRVRNFVQDDGHVFCMLEQVQSEVTAFIKQLYQLYSDFGFSDIAVKLSTRPEQRVGEDALWDRAEQMLQASLEGEALSFELLPGEGAFYGPKLEFQLRDCLGRTWQCGTMQLDFFIPQRLGATYIAEDGSKQVPVMLHRAALGSLERFIGILLEHYAGVLPLWLAPQQVVVLGISQKHSDYVQHIAHALQAAGLRVHQDLRNEKIGFKIREHTMARAAYLIVVGDHELENQSVTLRAQDGTQFKDLSLPDVLQRLQQELRDKSRVQDNAG